MTTKRVWRDIFHMNGNALHPSLTSTLVNGGTVTMGNGQVDLALAATNEVESARLSFGDKLAYPIANIIQLSFWAKITASVPASVTAFMGLGSAGNAAPHSMSAFLLFELSGNNNLLISNSDGTLSNTSVVVGDTLQQSFKKFTINLAEGTVSMGAPASNVGGKGGKSDVLFAVENSSLNQNVLRRVCPRTLFDMSNYSGNLQPYFQLQKTVGTAVATLSIKRVEVEYKM